MGNGISRQDMRALSDPMNLELERHRVRAADRYQVRGVYAENALLEDALYREEAYCDRREDRHKRILRNAKKRVREEGRQEGIELGRGEGHDLAMKHQQIWDEGVRAGEMGSGSHRASQRGSRAGGSRAGGSSYVSNRQKDAHVEKWLNENSRPGRGPPPAYSPYPGSHCESAGCHHG